jgi:hypothetical protein
VCCRRDDDTFEETKMIPDEYYLEAVKELEEMGITQYLETEVRDEMGMVYTAVVGLSDDIPEDLRQRYLQLCAEYGIEPAGQEDPFIPPLV